MPETQKNPNIVKKLQHKLQKGKSGRKFTTELNIQKSELITYKAINYNLRQLDFSEWFFSLPKAEQVPHRIRIEKDCEITKMSFYRFIRGEFSPTEKQALIISSIAGRVITHAKTFRHNKPVQHTPIAQYA